LEPDWRQQKVIERGLWLREIASLLLINAEPGKRVWGTEKLTATEITTVSFLKGGEKANLYSITAYIKVDPGLW
jgi:hypothetical protein